MDFLIGILLIVFGAPLVGILGRVLEGSGRERLGKAIGIGAYLAVLGVAVWLIIGSFRAAVVSRARHAPDRP